jgi:hypothetical protein
MATRLYPHTKNEATLERLAGVPAGTAAEHTRINAEFKQAKAKLNEGFAECDEAEQTRRRQEHFRLDEAEWEANHANPSVGTYDSFLTFGWGRVNHLCEGYSGFTDDPEKVAAILKAQGVMLPEGMMDYELEGLGWC